MSYGRTDAARERQLVREGLELNKEKRKLERQVRVCTYSTRKCKNRYCKNRQLNSTILNHAEGIRAELEVAGCCCMAGATAGIADCTPKRGGGGA